MKLRTHENRMRLRQKEPTPDMEPDDTFDVDQFLGPEDWKNLITKLQEELSEDVGGVSNPEFGAASIKEFFPLYVTEDFSPSTKFMNRTLLSLQDFHRWEDQTDWATNVIFSKWSYPKETQEVDPTKINPRMFEESRDWEEQALTYLLDPEHQTLSSEGIALVERKEHLFTSRDLVEYALLLSSPAYRRKVCKGQLAQYKVELQVNIGALRRGEGNPGYIAGILTKLLLATAQQIDFVDGHFKITSKKSQTAQIVNLPLRSHV